MRRSVAAGNAHVHKSYAPLSSRPAPCLRPKSSSPSLIAHSKIEKTPASVGVFYGRSCACSLKAHHRPEPESAQSAGTAVLRREGFQRRVTAAICDRGARRCSDPTSSTPTEQSVAVARRWTAAAEVQRFRRAPARSLLIASNKTPAPRRGFLWDRIFRPYAALRRGNKCSRTQIVRSALQPRRALPASPVYDPRVARGFQVPQRGRFTTECAGSVARATLRMRDRVKRRRCGAWGRRSRAGRARARPAPKSSSPSLIAHSKIEKNPGFGRGFFMAGVALARSRLITVLNRNQPDP